MRCNDVIELLSQYRNGELSPDRRAAVEAHLAGCGHCREALAGMEAALGYLHELSPEPAPPTLTAAVRARLQARPERPRAVLRRWALPVAAAGLLVVVAFGVMQMTAPKSAPPTAAMIARNAQLSAGPVATEASPRRKPATTAEKKWEASLPKDVRENLKSLGYIGPSHFPAPERPSAAPQAEAAKGDAIAPPTPSAAPSSAGLAQRRKVAGTGEGGAARTSPAMTALRPPTVAAEPGPAGPAGPAGPVRRYDTETPRRAAAKAAAPAARSTAPRDADELTVRAAEATAPSAPTKSAPASQAALAPASGGEVVADQRDVVRGAEAPAASAASSANAPSGLFSRAQTARTARNASVKVAAQATTSQLAGRNLTLQVQPDEEVDHAQVAVRSGAGEKIVWQGRLAKSLSNSVNVQLAPHSGVQQVVISGSQLPAETYYVFAPQGARRAPAAPSVLGTAKERRAATTWGDALQNLASERAVYILAPANFPTDKAVTLEAPGTTAAVGSALRGIGFQLRSQYGALTITAAPPPATPGVTNRASDRPARARRRNRS